MTCLSLWDLFDSLLRGYDELGDYMTTTEVAEQLGISRKELLRLHRLGFGPPRHRDEDGIFYLRSDVDDWEDESGWYDIKVVYIWGARWWAFNPSEDFKKINVGVQG